MCWILWIVSNDQVVQDLYDWLTMLQHRWQDAAWIVTFEKKKKYEVRWQWFVRDVFKQKHIDKLKWIVWIWHVRYPTAWCHMDADEAQPFYVNSPFWITLAHNGNLINTESLAEELFEQDLRHLSTNSDSEVILNVLAHELSVIWKKTLKVDDVFVAVSNLHKRCKWAYACISYIFWNWMLVFRDPFGIRPLCFWEKIDSKWHKQYIFASESVAISNLWYSFCRDVKPWEAIFIDVKWKIHSKICHDNPVLTPCLFEFIYLSRPDSIIDSISVYKARLRLWDSLWRKILCEWMNLDIDVVMPIPDTSRTAAVQVAKTMNLPYREWFIKNRYIWRTFIMPGQKIRKKSIRRKLNPIQVEFVGKNVLLIDDSIVRWNTVKEIIIMAREAWAKKVYIASAAPKIKYHNVYWIDIPTKNELIANKWTTEQMCKIIWADYLFYQDIDWVWKIIAWEQKVDQFEMSCFDWKYCTWWVDAKYIKNLEAKRWNIS